MQILPASLPGVLVFRPTPHRDDRGLFVRTFDLALAREQGLPEFVQDSQSRSRLGTIRGLHGRSAAGEAKLVRCARGAVHDVLVDARPDSPMFGRHEVFRLDDETFDQLFVPPGLLHGFQALTETSDVCYRIDRPHDPAEDLAVRFDDPDLDIRWPLPVTAMSERDRAAGSWRAVRDRL
ncbi:MAG TPA: dTDP-4-dehydrorhamnose 3,5-epimerase family protein [Pseudonocardia sp.]|uniref:dTDP-4-dehydrorhamnose 3,5-epimerase family protein n=1 Tax=Pseudonocardia sp. TaxID=60912 RepID=UPI002ED8DAF7